MRGDLVRVWSFQSFFDGGFINGRLARVKQNVTAEPNTSVILIVERKISKNDKSNSFNGIDVSYEVYCQQIEFIRHGTEEEIEQIEHCIALNTQIREYEQNHRVITDHNKSISSTPFHYAPEFFFDENTVLQLNKDLLEYPEIFI